MNIRQIMSAAFAIGVSMSGWAFDWSGKTGIVELPAGDVEVNEADLPVVTELTEIQMPDATTRLIFQATSDFTLKGMIHGEGKIVKKNANTMTLGEINCATKIGGACADHYVTGGFEVENGTLELPQASTTVHSYPTITLGSAATLRLQKAAATYVRALIGSGTVTSAATANQGLLLGFNGDTTTGDFTGKILGGKITVSVTGHARLLGSENTSCGNSSLTVYRNNNNGAGKPIYGVLDIVKFGKTTDAASSVGSGSVSLDLRFSGWLTYLGSGEETDKSIAFRYIPTSASGFPATLDAGPIGGVTFTGPWEFAKASGTSGRVDLIGSNTVPCVVACEIKDGWNQSDREVMYVTKKGTGTWRFADHASRNNRGGIAVEEGTLQFDSLAEAGKVCSLGLATCLRKSYQGSASEDNDVDYAYLLGNATTTNVVFEYTGSGFSGATDRPIALTGLGAHFRNSASAPGKISFSGVSALAGGSGVKTLYLDGTNVTGRIGEIADGDGVVGVTKLDSGTWTMTGNLTFKGPLDVREGVLVVAKDTTRYTWYRFNIRETGNQVFWGDHLGFFDKDGNRVCTTMTWVDDVVDFSAGESVTAYNGAWKDWRYLKPGQITLGDTYTGGFIFHSSDSGSLPAFFNGTGYLRSAWYTVTPNKNNRGTWIPVVFRVPEGTPEIVAMDIVPRTTPGRITACSLDASVDGITWTELFSTNAVPYVTGTSWVSTGEEYEAGVPHMPAPEWRFAGNAGEQTTVSQLANVSAVSVAAGATLKAEDGLTLSKLTLDCAAGALGTIEGVTFAEEGVLNLTGVGKTDQVVTTSFVNCTGVGNLAKWTVRIDGVDSNRRFVEVGDGELKIRCRGLAVILR